MADTEAAGFAAETPPEPAGSTAAAVACMRAIGALESGPA